MANEGGGGGASGSDLQGYEYPNNAPSSVQHSSAANISEIDDDDDVHTESSPLLGQAELPAIADSVPLGTWLIGVVEAGERFAFFGLFGPLQNYIQLPPQGGIRNGGLGLGQKNATLIKLIFTIWCYVTPFFAAIVADQYLGRYRTILYSTVPYIFGLAVLTVSALRVDVEGSRVPMVGLFIAIVSIGIGTGGIKSNVNALVAEQYHLPDNPEIKLADGTFARVDYEATMRRIFLIFFMSINIGGFGALVTTAIEQRYGFFWAYALTSVVFCLGAAIVAMTGHLYTKTPPAGSILPNALRILKIGLFSGMDLDRARPENQPVTPPWTSELVDEVQQALSACRVFSLLPLWWCAYSQILTNLISQAGTMRTGSIPNDILPYSDALMVIIVAPIFDRMVYPYLNRRGINFSPMRRIAVGFFVCSLAMGYATILQSQIYSSAPCYEYPLSITCEEGRVPNDIHVLWQVPVYLLVAISEILVAATGLEFAYESAPKSMKSLVTSLLLLSTAVGMLLAMGFAQAAEDPYMVWFYGSLTVEVTMGGFIFCYAFRTSLRSGALNNKVRLR